VTRLSRISALCFVAYFLVACSDDDLAHFYSEGSGTWAPVNYDGAASGEYAPTRCYQTSASTQTCFN
jgi:hypothetical protein